MMLIMNGVSLLIVWVGAHQIDAGTMQVGDMMAFMQYAMQIIMSFLMVSMIFIMLPRASVSGRAHRRGARHRADDHRSASPPSPSTAGGPGPWSNSSDVSFRYPGAEDDVLCNITFTAKPGQTTAFIGSTGSGKSTLVNLIPRFYDVTEGQILVDGDRCPRGHPARPARADRLCPAEGHPLLRHIASNIRYGKPDATDEEVSQAAADRPGP